VDGKGGAVGKLKTQNPELEATQAKVARKTAAR
jgi:hypothetical protein